MKYEEIDPKHMLTHFKNKLVLIELTFFAIQKNFKKFSHSSSVQRLILGSVGF